MSSVRLIKLGTVPYTEALDLQMSLLKQRQQGSIPDTLLLLQHPPTITIGRSGKAHNLLASKEYLDQKGIHFERIGRGGDITFHGPGQLVGYPIMDLKLMRRDVRKYVTNLENTIVRTLSDFDIQARRLDGVVGVWVKRRKIASIGVGIKRWVTYHGFALNVNTDLSFFDMIIPCGLDQVQMTSIKDWVKTDHDINMSDVENSVIKSFSDVFGKKLIQ